MRWRSLGIAAGALLLAVAPPLMGQASAGCEPGVHIDASTADDARKKIVAAGYTDVHDFKKGCDNVWHAKATKNGKPVNVVLLTNGHVMEESD
jgi:hypothetical protein